MSKVHTLAHNWHDRISVRESIDIGDVDSDTDAALRAASMAAKQGQPLAANRLPGVNDKPVHFLIRRIFHPPPVWAQVIHAAAELMGAEPAKVARRVPDRGELLDGNPDYVTARLLVLIACRRASIHRQTRREWVPAWDDWDTSVRESKAADDVMTTHGHTEPDVGIWASMLAVEYQDG